MEIKPEVEGQLLAHYRLLEKIGEGGMGVVFKAWDARLERHVALKLLKPDALPHASLRARLVREARLASSLNHPYIATIYGLEHVDDQHVIVMEFLQGETLRQRLDRGPIDVRVILDLGVALADAL